jgi:hypothetical protein
MKKHDILMKFPSTTNPNENITSESLHNYSCEKCTAAAKMK